METHKIITSVKLAENGDLIILKEPEVFDTGISKELVDKVFNSLNNPISDIHFTQMIYSLENKDSIEWGIIENNSKKYKVTIEKL